MNKRKIKTFLNSDSIFEFGDYILFQIYEQGNYDGKHYNYNVSKPIMAIYLGCFVADQTIGFNFIRWNNDKHTVYITNEHVINHPTCKEVEKIESHIEWDDYIDILGSWKNKPNWKQIIAEYRKQNTKDIINSNEIDFDNLI